MAMGLEAWIDRQLSPSRVDDSGLDAHMPAPPEPPRGATPQQLQQQSRQSVQYLAQVRIARAVYSERQLQEVLVDFWFNHFNVFSGKGRTSQFVSDYELEAIRPHILGSFRELLGATAKSPAMLFYLDNWLSVDPSAANRVDAAAAKRARRPQGAGVAVPQAQRKRGLNENYARELLELHTLGVDGGYTQKDIIEVARAFTGWTITNPQRKQPAPRRTSRDAQVKSEAPMMMEAVEAGRFTFTAALHDRGEKIVLGQKIRSGGGIEDGEQVLDLVAAHPSTARHIATKLARRFVSDTPSEALVTRVAERFLATRGDLREVVRAVVTSEEFFSAESRRAKVKTPLEFVVSAVRTTGRDLGDPRRVVRALQQLGMPLYNCEPPTGYDDTADAWISAGALITRMNVAQTLAGPHAELVGGPEFQRR
jgi:uncharacterized protein (DUF1800 family)